jgi:hypothetical protein
LNHPIAQKEQVLLIIRQMVDEKQLSVTSTQIVQKT